MKKISQRKENAKEIGKHPYQIRNAMVSFIKLSKLED